MDRKKYLKDYHKRYQTLKRDELEEYIKDYRKKHKKSLKLYNAKYYQKNKEEYQQRYIKKKEQEKTKKMIEDYYHNNFTHVDIMRDRGRENSRRYKRNKRIKIYNRFGGRCSYCGQKIKIDNFEIDHKIPKETGDKGIHKYNNLLPSCKVCNGIKNNKTIEEFRSNLFRGKDERFYFEMV